MANFGKLPSRGKVTDRRNNRIDRYVARFKGTSLSKSLNQTERNIVRYVKGYDL